MGVAVNTYNGARLCPLYPQPEYARVAVKLPANKTYPQGQVLGELTATPGTYMDYASGHVDGSQVPKVILEYPCATDASGNITIGAVAGTGSFGVTENSAPAYFTGTFNTAELTGFDANAATILGGHLISGTVATGVYTF
jgi:hypothetical protein